MGNLSANFDREEFKCPCCGVDTIDFMTLIVLEDVRDNFGLAIKINSAYRCPKHNAEVGGAATSQHLYGRAVDFNVAGTDPAEVQAYLHFRYPDMYGIGTYLTFTHLDTRSDKARWGHNP